MAIAIVNTATFVETVSGTSHSGPVTLSAGTSRKIIVLAHIESTPGVTGVTFDGNAMTLITSVSNPSDPAQKTYAYYYDVAGGAASGSKTIDVSTSPNSIANVTWYAWQLSGAATGAVEYSGTTTADNTVTTISNTGVTSSAGAAILAIVGCGSATPTFTWNATVTERTESDEINYTSACADATGVSAGTSTVTATATVVSGNKNLLVTSIAAAGSSTLTAFPWIRA